MEIGLIIWVHFAPESHCNLMEIVVGFVECDGDAIALEGLKMGVVGSNER